MTKRRANQIVKNMVHATAELREIAEITLLEIDSVYRRTITQSQIDRVAELQGDKVKPW